MTEYCGNGSLYDYLVIRQKDVHLATLIRMARDIAAGILVCQHPAIRFELIHLQHLHKEGVIHRDIACRNVLVGADLSE